MDDASTKQKLWLQQAERYIEKACHLADKLSIATAPLLPGNEASSGGPTVPISVVVGRILRALLAHAADGPGSDQALAEAAPSDMEISPPGSIAAADSGGLGSDHVPVDAALCDMVVHPSGCEMDNPVGTQEAAPLPPLQEDGSFMLPVSLTQEICRFFSTPSSPLLQPAPPPRQPRRRKTYDMKNVRRSVRLANRPAMPAMKRVQITLCRRLGFPADADDDGHPPLEQVLKDYVAMFDTSLPDYAIAALANLLGTDDEQTE
ncbi:hypothetical protein BS78_05G158000 [Paspalum vaginatum]|nr:hypothetical protein BS78_05G158000 [Paspalum vaginatum]